MPSHSPAWPGTCWELFPLLGILFPRCTYGSFPLFLQLFRQMPPPVLPPTATDTPFKVELPLQSYPLSLVYFYSVFLLLSNIMNVLLFFILLTTPFLRLKCRLLEGGILKSVLFSAESQYQE